MKGSFVVTVRSFAEASQALRVADIIEFRIDLFPSLPEYGRIRLDKPTIVTIRRKEDGGEFQGSDEERLDLLLKYSKYSDYVDLENYLEDDVFLKFKKNKIIESYHNFKETPDYETLVDIVEGRRGDFVKIATMGRDKRDALKILRLLTEFENVIAFLMGRQFSWTRIVSIILGSPMIYCTLSRPIAPGQLDIYTAKKILKMI